jgi:hypothetical protein
LSSESNDKEDRGELTYRIDTVSRMQMEASEQVIRTPLVCAFC